MKHAIFIALALGSVVFTSCADDRAGVGSDRKNDTKAADKKAPDPKNPVVVMETSMGTIKIQLDDGHAPNTVKNFLTYVDDKFYDGTIFHRVMEDFMIQGGGFTPELKNAKSLKDIRSSEKKTHNPIKNEAPNGLSNVRGNIAMARTDDVDSATAQFYINVGDNRRRGLDDPSSPYCVFGKVIDGMDVVDKIRQVKTTAIFIDGRPALKDVPAEDVLIKSIRRADK